MSHMFNFGFGGFSWIIMIVVSLLRVAVVVGIIFLIVKLVSKNNNSQTYSHSSYDSSNRAMDILKERYAKGEISEAEYDEKMKKLKE